LLAVDNNCFLKKKDLGHRFAQGFVAGGTTLLAIFTVGLVSVTAAQNID
jgi:hypothetical protein